MGSAANGDGMSNNHSPDLTTVTVVGAGPAGLMLASNLIRYGIPTTILDDKPDRTSTGKADGMQPKTIETFKQLGLADELLKKGVKVFDIAFWESASGEPLKRTGRQIHYPDHVGASDPYILLAHQGMIEDVLIRDLEERGASVWRNCPFLNCSRSGEDGKVNVVYGDQASRTLRTDYVVGCDGTRSKVRPLIPGATLVGETTNASWGVLDGVIETDFPDLWSKVAVRTDHAGSVLWIPRERNMTRLYVQLSSTDGDRVDKSLATPEHVMKRAKEAMRPYSLEWKSIEWFGNYVVSQRVASTFMDPNMQMFIAGDAGHTHSALAAQGANTSMHDSFNLAWKLNLVVRGLAPRDLLSTYEDERRKIAQDLIDFDTGHCKAFAEGDEALARNFDENIRFLSGVGAEYSPNVLNVLDASIQLNSDTTSSSSVGTLKPGALITPAKVTRFIDANPVDIQQDIPMLSQFRIYIFVPGVQAGATFLNSLCNRIQNPSSFFSRVSDLANSAYTTLPTPPSPFDEYAQNQRYTPISKLFTYALVTKTARSNAEIARLPPLLQASRWTFYLDDIDGPGGGGGGGGGCTAKWFGNVSIDQAVIVNVRPDGYVGSIGRWEGISNADEGAMLGKQAMEWLEGYYKRFLQA